MGALEDGVDRRVNEHRTETGRSPLRRHAGLDAIARRHSRGMASGKVALGHAGFAERQAEAQRLVALSLFAENVSEHPKAKLDAVPEQAVSMWLESRGHRKNLEGSFELTGIGAASNGEGSVFITQIFVKPRPAPSAPPPAQRAE